MDTFRAFMGGLLATVLLVGVLEGATLLGYEFDLASLLATAFLEPSPVTWPAGVAMVFGLGGVFGLLHAQAYEELRRSGPLMGGIMGIVQWVLVGVALGLVHYAHPRMPDVVADPGWFGSALGGGVMLTLFVAQVLFGAGMGSLYRPRSKP